MVRPCVYQRRQKNMSQPVNAEPVQVVLREIQPESAPKTPDPPLQLISAQGSNRSCRLFQVSCRSHRYAFERCWIYIPGIVYVVDPLSSQVRVPAEMPEISLSPVQIFFVICMGV
jgi:hypothetical protein